MVVDSQEVLDVVHNILGFLKANCTREGHTYWLFRKKGEDVVKLYDLTSLNCFQVRNSFALNINSYDIHSYIPVHTHYVFVIHTLLPW